MGKGRETFSAVVSLFMVIFAGISTTAMVVSLGKEFQPQSEAEYSSTEQIDTIEPSEEG